MRRRVFAAGLVLGPVVLGGWPAWADDVGPEKGFFLTIVSRVAEEAAKEVGKEAGKRTLDYVWTLWSKPPVAVPPALATPNAVPSSIATKRGSVALDFLLVRGNALVALDPSRTMFHTGDRFAIRASANLPGALEIRAVNSNGETTIDSQWELAGGQPARIPQSGYVQFADPSGTERLTITFRPCRGVTGFSRPEVVAVLPACSTPPLTLAGAAIRRENDTVYIERGIEAADRFGATLTISHID